MNSDKLSWLVSRPIASRGLHDQLNSGIPENSIKAFEAAIKKNYSIALNVIVLTDDEVIVFYDDNLQRLCGDDVEVGKLKKNEYQLYNLSGTDQKISCLEDVLHCIDGRVPVLIEIMNYSTNENTNIAVLNTLLGYRGHVAIMSFDPFTLGWFRRFANTIPRGLLGCSFNGHDKNALMRMLLRNFFFNFSYFGIYYLKECSIV